MQISYSEPLSRGYAHMKRMLFEPFDLGKWFVVGFGCWLAQLVDGGGGGGGGDWSGLADLTEDSDAATLTPLAASNWEDFFGEGAFALGCGVMIAILVLVLLALIPLVLWLSSRGRFIFLDNVIHDEAAIKKPWHEFREIGNSLFLWRLGFFFAALVLVLVLIAPLGLGIYYMVNDSSSALAIPLIVLGSVAVMLAAIGISYVEMFLKHFVVPIMHREGLRTNAAWGRFLPLFKQNTGKFLLYGLFLVGLWIVIGIGLMLVILFTCCIAAIPLIIPYIGTVAMLPIFVTIRAFSLEFLQQWMPEIGVDGPPDEPVGEAPPLPAELPESAI
ncbi:MAG: hypothetical protein GY719_42950 [bacterium]|nr:hypothetical protein [bacterium]